MCILLDLHSPNKINNILWYTGFPIIMHNYLFWFLWTPAFWTGRIRIILLYISCIFLKILIHTLVYINLIGKALNLRQQSFLFFLQENGLICLCFLFSVKIVFCKYFVERKSEKIVLKADGWGRCYTYISASNLKKMKYHFLTDQKKALLLHSSLKLF